MTKLSSPYRSENLLTVLFTSMARVSVLRIFLIDPQRAYYQRQLEAATGLAIRAVQRELEKFERELKAEKERAATLQDRDKTLKAREERILAIIERLQKYLSEVKPQVSRAPPKVRQLQEAIKGLKARLEAEDPTAEDYASILRGYIQELNGIEDEYGDLEEYEVIAEEFIKLLTQCISGFIAALKREVNGLDPRKDTLEKIERVDSKYQSIKTLLNAEQLEELEYIEQRLNTLKDERRFVERVTDLVNSFKHELKAVRDFDSLVDLVNQKTDEYRNIEGEFEQIPEQRRKELAEEFFAYRTDVIETPINKLWKKVERFVPEDYTEQNILDAEDEYNKLSALVEGEDKILNQIGAKLAEMKATFAEKRDQAEEARREDRRYAHGADRLRAVHPRRGRHIHCRLPYQAPQRDRDPAAAEHG